MGSEKIRARGQAFFVVVASVVAGLVLAGCTFGDDQAGTAKTSGVGNWLDQNCVPEDCLRQCCNGADYGPVPRLVSNQGQVDSACSPYRTKFPAYGEYEDLLGQDWNYCVQDFADFPGGLCTTILPQDVIRKIGSDGKPVNAGLTFFICPYGARPLEQALEGVELIPQE